MVLESVSQTVNKLYDPHKVVVLLDPAAKDAASCLEACSQLKGKILAGGKPTAYVCIDRVCKPPATDAQQLRQLLHAD